MGRLSTHVLDTANGRPAAGMTIEFMEQVQGQWQLLKTVKTNSDGRADEPLLAAELQVEREAPAMLPLYANLVKLDLRLLEAASDLGAKPWKAFLKITLPLSKAGIIAGSMLVMIPVVGEFVIPEMLGGPDTLMIGRILWQEFFNNRDWPVASAVSIVMLLLLIIPIMIFHRAQAKEMEAKLA